MRLPRTVDRAGAEDAVRRFLSRPEPLWADGVASASIRDLEPLVAPWWVIEAEGVCAWTLRLGRLPAGFDTDFRPREEDWEWTETHGEVPMRATEVVAAATDGPPEPPRGAARTRRQAHADATPLPVVVSAEAAWAQRRASAERPALLEARAVSPGDAPRHERTAIEPRWERVEARLVHGATWKVTLGGSAAFVLWVDGTDGTVSGDVPLDEARVEARNAELRAQGAALLRRERWKERVTWWVTVLVAGAIAWALFGR
jgi:hypothetical protein